MTSLPRILSVLGLAGVALTGCAAPPDSVTDESSLTNPKVPHPRPPVCPPGPTHAICVDSEWAGYDPSSNPVTYPDYGIFGGGFDDCALPTPIDYENWNGASLWGTHQGIIVPFYTFNTADEKPGDYNTTRLELFAVVPGATPSQDLIVWHMFAPAPVPAAVRAMSGTQDWLCNGGGHLPIAGGLSSGKPPANPPQPPDGTGGGRVFICPAMPVEAATTARIDGCYPPMQ